MQPANTSDEEAPMLLDGINHVAVVTDDTDRFLEFYTSVFEATVSWREDVPFGRLTMVDVGRRTELNVFEVREGMDELGRGSMFTHGPIDHIGFQAADRDAFVEIRRRLVEREATDGFVTDFGRAHSVWFKDPDGLEGEVLLMISTDGPVHPPGSRAAGYD
jgi:catechol 2,3-dioxygenase-like lactoylglutathione lyase family enzyme